MFFDKVYYDENNNPIEIQIICDKCGKIILVTDIDKFQTIKSEYCILKDNICVECSCGNIGTNLIQYKNNMNIEKAIVKKPDTNFYKPKCPICNSPNLSKISSIGKAAKISLFGIYGADNLGKTYKCNNCGSRF